ncbi:hypothetical protein LLE49_15480 [Alicyclobacillus tolerans]|uniref:hypothetical protein n=1 Tax=Alicyclobacillus tolerans TaxID=90970 RepID=UPI001F327AD6|nr:hypothetical protein [Alicyclobacillus tolerans]MCF8566126.1 hypothetical protein [Alicyclobacillus tolerans]
MAVARQRERRTSEAAASFCLRKNTDSSRAAAKVPKGLGLPLASVASRRKRLLREVSDAPL